LYVNRQYSRIYKSLVSPRLVPFSEPTGVGATKQSVGDREAGLSPSDKPRGGPLDFTIASVRPLRHVVRQCENEMITAKTLSGVGETREKAIADLEKEERAFDILVEREGVCAGQACDDPVFDCVYDSANPGEPVCEKVTIKTKKLGREMEIWICKRDVVWGCFCTKTA
jgi:hypothetical protein